MPVVLCERLKSRHPHINWLVFLDNLFLSVDVAHVLLNIGIGVMGTTRKNAAGIPDSFKNIKQLNRALLYGGLFSIQCGWVLCFAWQDNNVVLGVTTSFSLHRPKEDYTIRTRRRPKDSATNAAIAQPVFQGQLTKALPIPSAIDAYNHGMNAVDVANQLRKSFTCHQAFEQRTWRPLAFWLFDVCLANSFILWRAQQPKAKQSSRHLHAQFEKALITQLLQRGPRHQPGRPGKRGRCSWGALHREDCQQEERQFNDDDRGARRRRRRPLEEITGNSRPQKRPRNVRSGCIECNVYLCIDRGCFFKWHVDLYEKHI